MGELEWHYGQSPASTGEIKLTDCAESWVLGLGTDPSPPAHL
jgi:hypothetical protein